MWWSKYPERLTYELDALDAAGISWERDEESLKLGIIKLLISIQLNDDDLELVAIFPDAYPYFRFEVFAPTLSLPYHQNPFNKNLCLIGRSTRNWNTNDTLADFLTNRLPLVIRTAEITEPAKVVGLEEAQAEPLGTYYTYLEESMLIIDGAWRLQDSSTQGTLRIGLRSICPLQGAILQLEDNHGELFAAEEGITAAYDQLMVNGRWVRINEPILDNNPEDFLRQLSTIHRQVQTPNWKTLSGGRTWIQLPSATAGE